MIGVWEEANVYEEEEEEEEEDEAKRGKEAAGEEVDLLKDYFLLNFTHS